jgi:hypothetical protein
MRTTQLFLAALLVGFGSWQSTSRATPIVSEDFESYADTVALGGVWSLGDGTLDSVLGNPGNSLSHPGTSGSFTGGNTNSIGFAAAAPGAGETLIFSADIYDDAGSSNERNTAGLRAAAGANIIELGHYNQGSHYSYRTVLFAGGDTGWQGFTGVVDDGGSPILNAPVAGWHRYSAEVTTAGVTLSLDLNSDGNINATAFVPVVLNPAGFDIIRLGGPSDFSSAGGGVNFDNINLELVPEPSSIVLLSMAGLALVARRRS